MYLYNIILNIYLLYNIDIIMSILFIKNFFLFLPNYHYIINIDDDRLEKLI